MLPKTSYKQKICNNVNNNFPQTNKKQRQEGQDRATTTTRHFRECLYLPSHPRSLHPPAAVTFPLLQSQTAVVIAIAAVTSQPPLRSQLSGLSLGVRLELKPEVN